MKQSAILSETPQVTASSDIRQIVGLSVGSWSFIAAAALAAFYLGSSVYIASHRLFWFDEFFTIRIAQLPGWTMIWGALAHTADSHPPIYYMIVRASEQWIGHSEVGPRLPSVLAMVAGLLVTFDCARRLTDGVHGLIATSILTCSFLPYYGYEARPYAIVFLLSAVAFWIWVCMKPAGRWPAICFGATFFLGCMFHYYFFLCLAPYALWEMARWKPWQRPSAKLVAAVAGVALGFALLTPLIMSGVSFTHKYSRVFSQSTSTRPSLYALEDIFSSLFPLGFFLLSVMMVWAVLADPGNKRVVLSPMLSGESVGWLCLCIPLVGFALAEWRTNSFVPRYFIGALPGIAGAFACWLWRHFHAVKLVSVGVLVLATAVGVAQQLGTMRHPDDRAGFSRITRQYLDLEGALRSDGKRVALFSDPSFFVNAEYYAKNPCILLLPSGFKRDSTGSLPLLFVAGLSTYYPYQLAPPFDVKKHVEETALILPSPEVLELLRQEGFQVEVRYSKPLKVVYLH